MESVTDQRFDAAVSLLSGSLGGLLLSIPAGIKRQVQEVRIRAGYPVALSCGPVFENGDSRKQLLSRSIYLLYKKESLWTESQRVRAGIKQPYSCIDWLFSQVHTPPIFAPAGSSSVY